jgi:nucleoside-diphosphate-sugar epimerase
MARCLVTGHKGYIGTKLFNRLKELGHDVRGIDLLEEHPKDINIVLREGSDKKFHPHYYNFKPEFIFHMACIPRVAYSVQYPVETNENNILAGSNVLNFARKVGSVKRVIYSSSSSILGNGDGPESPYALQKLTTEIETALYSKLYGLDTVSLRYFNVYSHDQEATGPYATVVANWMKCARENKQPFITGDGEQKRDMINVADVVEANIFCMNYENDLNGRAFDVGTGNNISLNKIKEIALSYHPDLKFKYVAPRPGDVLYSRANVDPLFELGWKNNIEIEDGINDCFGRIR